MSIENLFTPIKIGALSLTNRIFMAPMTRLRSLEPGDIPTSLMAEYYAQRASAGLIITEATQVSFQAKGYSGAPGLHTPAQVAGWQQVNQAIHDAGGHSCVQLWHTGRISHTSLQADGAAPVAPSAIKAASRISLRDENRQVIRVDTSMPRALTVPEIHGIIQDFADAVGCARQAGFDLIELHAAHGYLLHQFFSPEANHRQDEYGGSLEKRARFVLEVVDAAIAAWSAQRIGIRIFPQGPFNGVDAKPGQADEALYLIAELAKRQIAFLHISEPDWVGGEPYTLAFREQIRTAFPGPIIGAGAYTAEKAADLINRGLIDAVAFGRPYIANPDLPERLQQGLPLAAPRADLFYGNGPEGYTDYPRASS